MLLLLTLKVRRLLKKLSRRLFGNTLPHWIKDIAFALKPLKILAFIPTVIAIASEPRHLFRRIPIILSGAKTPYVSPIGFLIGGVAIAISSKFAGISYLLAYKQIADDLLIVIDFLPKELLLFLAEIIISISKVQIYLGKYWWLLIAIFLVLIPVLMIALSIISLIMLFPFAALLGAPPRKLHFLFVVMDPRTYYDHEVKRIFWGYFYFALYFFILFPFLVFALHSSLTLDYSLLKIATFRVLYIYFSLMLYLKIFILPYIELLRASRRTPTLLMLRMDISEIESTYDLLKTISTRKIKISTLNKHLKNLNDEWIAYSRTCRQDEISAARQGVSVLDNHKIMRASMLKECVCFEHKELVKKINPVLDEEGLLLVNRLNDNIHSLIKSDVIKQA